MVGTGKKPLKTPLFLLISLNRNGGFLYLCYFSNDLSTISRPINVSFMTWPMLFLSIS